MIISPTPQFGRVARYLGLPLLSLLIWDVLVVLAYQWLHWEWVSSRHIPLALYGSAIGLVVGFRNSLAYSRWWEARTLWGQIVNNSRSLSRQVCEIPPTDPRMAEMQRRIVYYQIAFMHALRQQLRGLDPVAAIQPMMSSGELAEVAGQNNIPLALQWKMGRILREAQSSGLIDHWTWQSIDRTLCDLMAAQGGTERIKNTPLPKQYDFFPMLFVQIYCFLLPAGMVAGLGWFTPLGSTLVGFIFLALDRIGRNLENPFDNTIYDLPLTAMTINTEINLRQMLGESNLPSSACATNGVLW
jgi:putative membrane protein